MKKILNSICLFFFNRVAFPSKYKGEHEEINFRGFIHFEIDRLSTDTKRFKIY